MNIFVTDFCPKKSAEVLDDSRCIKMILESAQLMSNAINIPYKRTHFNHPCSVWVRESQENYNWLLNHFYYLCEEYTKRFKRVHKCFGHYELFSNNKIVLPSSKLTPFVNCTNHKEIPDVYLAYKTALIQKWIKDKRLPKWTNSFSPEWYKI